MEDTEELALQHTSLVRRQSEDILRLTGPSEHDASTVAAAANQSEGDRRHRRVGPEPTRKKKKKPKPAKKATSEDDSDEIPLPPPKLVEQTTLEFAPSQGRTILPPSELLSMTEPTERVMQSPPEEKKRTKQKRKKTRNSRSGANTIALSSSGEDSTTKSEQGKLDDTKPAALPIATTLGVVASSSPSQRRSCGEGSEVPRPPLLRETISADSTEEGENVLPGAQRMRGDSRNEDDEDDKEVNTSVDIHGAPVERPAALIESSVTATAVTRDDLEEEVRRRVYAEAVTAEVVRTEPEPMEEAPSSHFFRRVSLQSRTGSANEAASEPTKHPYSERRLLLLVVALCICVVVGGVVGVIMTMDIGSDSPSSDDSSELVGDDQEDPKVLRAVLVEKSPAVATKGTPQNEAFRWMVARGIEWGDPLVLETFALVTLYRSTNGESWTHSDGWLRSTDICNWYPGNICDDDKNRTLDELETKVLSLDLEGNSLNGTLPSDIGLLTDLQLLNVNDNGLLSGSIPSTIVELDELVEFSAQNASFTGSFPSEMGSILDLEKLRKLKTLDLSGVTTMTGYWPENVWRLPRMHLLNLEGMNLRGKVPDSRKSPHIAYLANNQLTGPILLSKGSPWKGLKVLDLRNNSLTGTIPEGLGNAWGKNLLSLQLEGNDFSGVVGSEVCDVFTQKDTDMRLELTFSSDCGELEGIQCDCCTLCCSNGRDCEPQISKHETERFLRGG